MTALPPPTTDQHPPTNATEKLCNRGGGGGHMAPIDKFVGVNGTETKICLEHREQDRAYKRKSKERRKVPVVPARNDQEGPSQNGAE